MRRIARVDRNQAGIVFALRAASAKVKLLHQLGDGTPDLLVKRPEGGLLLMEVKMPGERLTEDEQVFYNEWKEDMVVVYSIEDALSAIGRL